MSANNANGLLAATKLWHHVDASGMILGKLAVKIALTLQGKHKPTYHPTVDQGDYVVVTNCNKIQITGRKLTQKIYYSHSGYPGGLKALTYKNVFDKDPCEPLRKAVWGMLPRNETRKKRMERLKLFADNHNMLECNLYRQYLPKYEGDTNIVKLPDNIYK